MMTAAAHLWAIGYADMLRAAQVREEIIELAWGAGMAGKYLILEDIAEVVRHPDGSFTFDRKPFPGLANILASTGVGFLAGLALAAPLTGATIGALLGSAGTAVATHAGIKEDFIREVEAMMKSGTSALFVLDEVGDMEVFLHEIRGLGGTVLKTNVAHGSTCNYGFGTRWPTRSSSGHGNPRRAKCHGARRGYPVGRRALRRRRRLDCTSGLRLD
jgi:uncharacterized membrane protein